jgi:hypothetical protein
MKTASTSKSKKPRKRPRESKALTVFNGVPSQEEIDKIRHEIKALVTVSRSLLPRAFRIGEWFLDCRHRIAHGDWGDWIKTAFPNVSYSNIRLYVRLAQHRQYLEVKFRLNENDSQNVNTGLDFERLTSIKEADTAIRSLRAAEKLGRHGEGSKGSYTNPIDVKATVVSGKKNNSKSASKPISAGSAIRIHTPPDATNGTPLQTLPEDPAEVLVSMLTNYAREVAEAEASRKGIIDWIKIAALDAEAVENAIWVATRKFPELLDQVRTSCSSQPEIMTAAASANSNYGSASPELASHTDRGEGPA